MALLLVQFGPKATQILRIVGLGMTFTGLSFAHPFFMIQPLAMLFLPAFDVFILRHGGADGWSGAETY